jgi:hypothetical protein
VKYIQVKNQVFKRISPGPTGWMPWVSGFKTRKEALAWIALQNDRKSLRVGDVVYDIHTLEEAHAISKVMEVPK